MSAEWDSEFVAPWHGFPSGTATCSVVPVCQSTLTLVESEVLLQGREGVVTRRPCLSFLITHPDKGSALFDLGIPKDWLKWFVTDKAREAYQAEFNVEIDRDLHELLLAGAEGHEPVSPEEIQLLLISHQHWDHTGSPSSFPNARVIVGSTDEAESIPALADHSRVTPINWDPALHPPITSFDKSFDVFDDGSLIVLDARGHTPGHIGALVRTGLNEYVMLFADGCHHHCLSSVRPEDEHFRFGLFRGEGDSKDEPPTRSYYDDYAEASRSLQRMKALQRREEVLCISAHDEVVWKFWGGGDNGWGPELQGWRAKGLKMA